MELVFSWRTYPWNDRERTLRIHQERLKLTPEVAARLELAWARASLGGPTQVVVFGDLEIRFTHVEPILRSEEFPWDLDGASCVAACMSMPWPSRTLKRNKWQKVLDTFRATDIMELMRIWDKLEFSEHETGEHAWGGAGQTYQTYEVRE